MPRKLAAALLSLITFAAVLAVVPLASPAGAHPLYGTVKRCAYDPFAGQQCWYETVRQWHYHPPATDAEEEAKRKAEQEAAEKAAKKEARRKAAEDEARRKAAERKAAEEEARRKAAEEERKRLAAEEERKRLAAEEERKRQAAERLAAEEERKRLAAEEERKRQAAERLAAEEERKRLAAEEERKRQAAEEERKRLEEEEKKDAESTDPCAAWIEATRTALHNSRPLAPAPEQCRSGDDPVALLWKVVKPVVDKIAVSNGEAALAEAEIRQLAATETVEAFLQEWDKLTPRQKGYFIGTVCTAAGLGVLAGSTAVGAPITGTVGGAAAGVACGAELGEADRNRVERYEREKAEQAQTVPRKGGTAAARPQPDITPDTSPDGSQDDDSDEGDADGHSGGTDEESSGDDEDGDSDPSLEGSWHDVRRRHAPQTSEDAQALYQRYMCNLVGYIEGWCE